MTAQTPPLLEPSAGDQLLQLARVYLRDVLKVPDEVAALRQMVAELMLETGFLRHDLGRLQRCVEALEKRLGLSG